MGDALRVVSPSPRGHARRVVLNLREMSGEYAPHGVFPRELGNAPRVVFIPRGHARRVVLSPRVDGWRVVLNLRQLQREGDDYDYHDHDDDDADQVQETNIHFI